MDRRKSRDQHSKLEKWLSSDAAQNNYNASFHQTDKKYKYVMPVQGTNQNDNKDKINFVTEIPKNLNVIKGIS